MINKYYLYKMILENPVCIAELKYKPDVMSDFFNIPVPTEEELYRERIKQMNDVINASIKTIKTLTGYEAVMLIDQKESIIGTLTKNTVWQSIETSLHLPETFKEALEEQFNVTLDHICDYEKAEQLLIGERLISVILDGNNTKLIVNGKEQRFRVKIYDNNVTLDDCHKAISRLAEFNCYPKKIQFLLNVYTKTKDNEFGDYPEECLLDKKVNYNVEKNKMTVWENGYPVFENENGVICDDKDVLADYYM